MPPSVGQLFGLHETRRRDHVERITDREPTLRLLEALDFAQPVAAADLYFEADDPMLTRAPHIERDDVETPAFDRNLRLTMPLGRFVTTANLRAQIVRGHRFLRRSRSRHPS